MVLLVQRVKSTTLAKVRLHEMLRKEAYTETLFGCFSTSELAGCYCIII